MKISFFLMNFGKVERYFNTFAKKNIRVFIILVLLGFLTYANVLNGPFLFDDEHFIEKNVMVQSLKNIPDIYSSSVTEGAGIHGNFYRPNQQLMYAVLFRIFGLNSTPYHFLSILLHIINAFLIFSLLKKLHFSNVGAFISSLFFLLHPVQTEAVAYISGLADPLGYFFSLSGLNLFAAFLIRGAAWRIAVSTLFLLLALFSKENQVVFLPIAILLYFYLGASKRIRFKSRHLVPLNIFLVMVVGYLYLKFRVFNFNEGIGLTDSVNVYTEYLHIRIYTFISILWDYAKLIVFPWDLHYEKPYTAYASLWQWRAAFGAVLILLFISSAIFIKRSPGVFLGLGWFFAGLLPFTGIIPLNAMFLEHWLYIPLTGMAILLAALYEQLESIKVKNILLLVFTIVMVLFGARAIARNAQWADIEKFYLNELKYTGQSIRIYNNLGMYYSDAGDDTKAVEYYQKSILVGDHYPQPHHNLANLYLERGDTATALNELHRALQIDPNFIYSLHKLYEVFQARGETLKSIDAYGLLLNASDGKRNSLEDINALF